MENKERPVPIRTYTVSKSKLFDQTAVGDVAHCLIAGFAVQISLGCDSIGVQSADFSDSPLSSKAMAGIKQYCSLSGSGDS